jgi:predicted DNA-binding transcriptional regulator
MERPNGSHRRHQSDQGTGGKAKHPKGTRPARRKTADRFAVLNAFIDFTMGTLTRNEIAVWLLLYRDTKDGTARTSQADLARRAGVSDRTVRNVLRQLARKRLLRVAHRGGIGRGPSRYRIRPLPPDR